MSTMTLPLLIERLALRHSARIHTTAVLPASLPLSVAVGGQLQRRSPGMPTQHEQRQLNSMAMLLQSYDAPLSVQHLAVPTSLRAPCNHEPTFTNAEVPTSSMAALLRSYE